MNQFDFFPPSDSYTANIPQNYPGVSELQFPLDNFCLVTLSQHISLSPSLPPSASEDWGSDHPCPSSWDTGSIPGETSQEEFGLFPPHSSIDSSALRGMVSFKEKFSLSLSLAPEPWLRDFGWVEKQAVKQIVHNLFPKEIQWNLSPQT